jgi:hypothetical protein
MSMLYAVNPDSVRAAFSSPSKAPALLVEFADFVAKLTDASIGYFEMPAAPISDQHLALGDDLSESFASLFALPDGGVVALWLDCSTAILDQAPVIYLPHDDAPSVVALHLADFLWRIVDGDDQLPSDFLVDGDDDDAPRNSRPELAAWLVAKHQPRPVRDALAWQALVTQFDARMEQHQKLAEGAYQHDPISDAIAEKLSAYQIRWVAADSRFGEASLDALRGAVDAMREYLPAADQLHLPTLDQTWLDQWQQSVAGQRVPEVDFLEVQIADRLFELNILQHGELRAVPEAALVEPLLRQLRERDWRAHPERGVWFSASLTISEQGVIELRRYARARPRLEHSEANQVAAAVAADLARFPRGAFWQLERD